MKTLKKIAAILLAAATASGAGMLAACSDGEQGATGATGATGKSAYEIAVDNGFSGTEAQWLASLKGTSGLQGSAGKSAYEVAVANGFKGSEAEWLESLKGADGEDGSDGGQGLQGSAGKSAYEIAVANGFKGSQAEWLESLKGADGEDGSDGGQGLQGSAGKSAYEIAVENGFQGSKAEWLESLKGTDGEDGANGTKWFTGRGLPSAQNLSGVNEGDFYINLNTNTIYSYEQRTWHMLVNVNEKGNISKWDGKIPGWQSPNLSDAEIIGNRPVSYVVNESNKSVDLYNAEAFAWFAYRAVIGKIGYEGYTVNLHCDIDLDNKLWIPIGLGARSNAAGIAFRGTFDGNGHTIYNLNGDKFINAIQYGNYENILGATPTTTTGYYINYVNGDVNVNIHIHYKDDVSGDEVIFGLFGNSYNATFKNVNIEGVTISTTSKDLRHDPDGKHKLLVDSVGSLLGYGLGNLTVENCNSGNPDGGDLIKVYTTAAGLVGRVYAGVGENNGVINGTIPPYGKIKISDCNNYVDVELDGEKLDKVAGIIAFPNRYSEVIIENCVNFGNIKGGYAGGILGYSDGKTDMESPVSITDCSNHGNITGNYAGGLMGHRGSVEGGSNASYTVNRFTNHGDITGEKICQGGDNLYAGGIAGDFYTTSTCGIFTECYNHGNVTIKNATTASNYAGGLFGYIRIIESSIAGKKQGSVILSGINMGEIRAVNSATAATVNIYGCGYVSVADTLKANYKQIYYFNSGLLYNGETAVTDKENTNL